MWNPDPFLEPANPRWPAIVADAFVELLAVRGLHEFSMAAVARWMRASTAAVAQRAPRQESLRMIIVRIGVRYHRWSVRPAYCLVEPRLPATDVERRGVRAWALLGELARGDPEGESRLAELRAEERADVEEWWLGQHGQRGPEGIGDGAGGSGGVTACDFEGYFAVLTGLRLAMAFGMTKLSAEQARAVLDRLAPPPHGGFRPGPASRAGSTSP